jgi:hypothetical protein
MKNTLYCRVTTEKDSPHMLDCVRDTLNKKIYTKIETDLKLSEIFDNLSILHIRDNDLYLPNHIVLEKDQVVLGFDNENPESGVVHFYNLGIVEKGRSLVVFKNKDDEENLFLIKYNSEKDKFQISKNNLDKLSFYDGLEVIDDE